MRVFFTALALSIAATCAAAAEHDEPIRLDLSWNVSLDPAGNVTALGARPNVRADRAPQIRERLETEIRRWHFQPGSIDGKAQPTDTVMTLSISLLPPGASASMTRAPAGTSPRPRDRAFLAKS